MIKQQKIRYFESAKRVAVAAEDMHMIKQQEIQYFEGEKRVAVAAEDKQW